MKARLLVASVLWLAVVCAGMAKLLDYSAKPGAAGPEKSAWPPDSTLQPAKEQPTLLLFAHPRCPCTRASLAELARLLARSESRVRAYVLFMEPVPAPDGWIETSLWESARNIPGVTALRDRGGEEARRFGALTSGHVLVYDRDGSLLFSGGITPSRGHEGDSYGKQAVLEVLLGKVPETRRTPIFGCALGSSEQAARARS